jgi:FixJ family two-component response regulator
MDALPADTKAIIAVVDDDEAILDALELLLAVSGWEARTYKTGEAFMDDLSEKPPSCLILDPHLPGLSGADIARTLSTRKPAIPIIGITARPGSKLAIEVVSAGADVMLTKPVSAENIVSKVRAAMA